MLANEPRHTTPPTDRPAGDATALIKLLAAQLVAEHFAARASSNDEQDRSKGDKPA